VVQLRFKHLHSPYNVVLSIGEFEVFYNALSRLMEYISQEYEARE